MFKATQLHMRLKQRILFLQDPLFYLFPEFRKYRLHFQFFPCNLQPPSLWKIGIRYLQYYALPSTTMTYDRNALTFINPGRWLTSKESGSKVSNPWQVYHTHNITNILYGSDPTLIERLNTGYKVGNLLDYCRLYRAVLRHHQLC